MHDQSFDSWVYWSIPLELIDPYLHTLYSFHIYIFKEWLRYCFFFFQFCNVLTPYTCTCTFIYFSCRCSTCYSIIGVILTPPLPHPRGGMSHWGLYIIRVNHFLKSTLNEDEATVPTALWTLHRACAPGYSSQISYPFRGLSAGSVNLIPFFSDFPVFDTLNARRALRAGWRKRYPFYAFLLTRMMYRPQWDMPPGSPPPSPFFILGIICTLPPIWNAMINLMFTDVEPFISFKITPLSWQYCPTLAKGSKWHNITISVTDVVIFYLVCSSSRPTLMHKHSSC